jgi:hypothetical protein
MLSAIQVKETEKRKHASLTIVGVRQDFALRIGRQSESHNEALFGRVLGNGMPDTPEKGTYGVYSKESNDVPPTVKRTYPSG